ncbi:MAG: hypothetical protein ACE5GS_14370 [Kiloniellaceae bacterium]
MPTQRVNTGPEFPATGEELTFLLNCYDIWSGPTEPAIPCEPRDGPPSDGDGKETAS